MGPVPLFGLLPSASSLNGAAVWWHSLMRFFISVSIDALPCTLKRVGRHRIFGSAPSWRSASSCGKGLPQQRFSDQRKQSKRTCLRCRLPPRCDFERASMSSNGEKPALTPDLRASTGSLHPRRIFAPAPDPAYKAADDASARCRFARGGRSQGCRASMGFAVSPSMPFRQVERLFDTGVCAYNDSMCGCADRGSCRRGRSRRNPMERDGGSYGSSGQLV